MQTFRQKQKHMQHFKKEELRNHLSLIMLNPMLINQCGTCGENPCEPATVFICKPHSGEAQTTLMSMLDPRMSVK